MPVHVLHHHDGIVHHQADGQHHRQQGQQIEAETEHQHQARGPQHRQRDGHHRDQHAAQRTQAQPDHQHHDQHRLHQGAQHLMDRSIDEARSLIGQRHLHPGRQGLLDLRQQLANALDNHQRVAGRRGKQPQVHGRLAVHGSAGLGGSRTELDGADIAQAHQVGAIVADDQLTEVLDPGQVGVHLDIGQHVLPTHLARRRLVVVGPHRLRHVRCRHPAPGHLFAVQPQAHGQPLPTERLHLGHAVDA